MKSIFWTLGVIMTVLFGVLLIVTFEAPKNKILYSGEDMVTLVNQTPYVIDTSALDTLQDYQIIALSEVELIQQTGPDVVWMPFSDLLSEESKLLFERNNPKVIQSENSIQAHEAWMLMTKLGYRDIFILKGD